MRRFGRIRSIRSPRPVWTRAAAVATRPYGSSAWWNMTLAARGQTTVHADSAAILTSIIDDGSHGLGAINEWSTDTHQFTMPVYEIPVGGSVTNQDVTISSSWRYGTDSTVAGSGMTYPYVVSVPMPTGVTLRPAAGSDSQVVIFDWINGHEWNFFNCGTDGSGDWDFTCQNASRYEALSTGKATPGADRTYSAGNTLWNTRGAKVPYAAGLVRLTEVQAAIAVSGGLDHALAWAADYALANNNQAESPAGLALNRNAYHAPSVYPAVHSDGGFATALSTDSDDPPEGLCLRVASSVTEGDMTTEGLSDAAKVLVRTLQTYGAFMIDQSGRTKIYLESDESADWAGAGITTTDMLADVPWSWFEVLAEPTDRPAASATADDLTPTAGDVITLTGTPEAITDPNTYARSIVEHLWVPPGGVTLSSTTVAAPTWDTTGASGGYLFDYYARDSKGWWQHADVTVTVGGGGGPSGPPALGSTAEAWGGVSSVSSVDEDYVSSSFTPDADEELYLCVSAKSTSADTISVDDSAGLTWTQVGSRVTSQNNLIVEVWHATASSSPSSMTVTVTVLGESGAGRVCHLVGVEPGATFVQAGTGDDGGVDGTAATASLSGVGTASRVIAFVTNRAGSFTPGGSWTDIIGDTTFSSGGTRINLSSMDLVASGSVTASGTISSSTEWIVFAIEVEGLAGGGGPTFGRVYHNGSWKAVTAERVYQNGAWRSVTAERVYQNGAWRATT